VTKVRYYKMTCPTGGKFHITIGHDTVMAKTSFFGTDVQSPPGVFDYSLDYLYQNELHGISEKPSPSDGAGPIDGGGDGSCPLQQQYALVEFERPVIISPHCVAIGSKLDADAYSNICRIAFHGTLLELTTDKDYHHSFLPRLKIYKMKSKEGIVERVTRKLP
jgi:selenocysteine-specific elongation factor